MKSSILAPVVVFALAFFAHQYRHELRLAEPINALLNYVGDGQPRPDFAWPPQMGQQYSDLALYDQTGRLTRLSEFRGKILLIEPIGMPCKACQAYSGGHERGGFHGIAPQPGLPSTKIAARTYGSFDLSDPRIVKIHLLLFNLDMRAPTVDDARAWADHFGLKRERNEIVLAGSAELLNQASYDMIPGFHLVDQNFTLRYDSTGRANRRHDLYRELLPGVRTLLELTNRP